MSRKPGYRRYLRGVVATAVLVLGLLSVSTNFSFAANPSSPIRQHNAAAEQYRPLTHGSMLSQLAGKLAPRSQNSTAPRLLPATGSRLTHGPRPAQPTPVPPSASATAPSTPAPDPSTPAPTTSPTTGPPSAPAPTQTPTPGPNSTLLWSDEFNGPAGSMADSGTWERINGGRWGNGELECYSDGSKYSSMDGSGNLVLTARYTPGHQCMYGATNDYTSARLSSDGRAITASHGSIRVRAKLPAAQGVWPAIWALGANDDSVGWPNAGEIDMAEAIGQSNEMYGNIHFPSSQGPAAQGTGYTLSSAINTSFHVYGVDWSPNSVRLSVDNHVYKTITKSDVTSAGGSWVFDRPFFILLNIAVGGTWPGNPKDNGVFPQSMTVDYVRVYK